jgi:pathogenesis-related protein 1
MARVSAIVLTCALLCAIALCFASVPYDVGKDARLAEHNAARSSYGLPFLVWDDNLAAVAQQHASQCIFQHSKDEVRRPAYCQLRGISVADCDKNHNYLGENIAWNTNGSWGLIQKGFYDEVANWHCDTNACNAGTMCGHFTQIIWAVTTSVGCGAYVCDANTQISTPWIYSVCNYYIGGNWDGQHPLSDPRNCNGPVVPYTPNHGSEVPNPPVPPVPPGPVPPVPIPPASTTGTPIKLAQATILSAHNKARATRHQVKLTWSATHYNNALKKAKACASKTVTTSTYGQAVATYKGLTAAPSVSTFVAEGKYWTCRTDKCKVGHSCKRYRQVVWGAARTVGCAAARCKVNSPYGAASKTWTILVCNYSKKATTARPFAVAKC